MVGASRQNYKWLFALIPQMKTRYCENSYQTKFDLDRMEQFTIGNL